MAESIYGDESPRHKTSKFSLNTNPPTKLLGQPLPHSGIVADALISPDDQIAVLCAIDATGDATLADCAAALPDHSQPISAIVALAAMGVIAFDQNAPFDAHIRVRRA
jgi:hypothetical protein